MAEGDELHGWHPDPFGRYEERYFIEGEPSELVRSKDSETRDPASFDGDRYSAVARPVGVSDRVAIVVSGGVAAVFGAAAGKSFVAGDPPSVTYRAARCADFFEYAPHARNCEQAATEHHYGRSSDIASQPECSAFSSSVGARSVADPAGD